VSTVATPSGRLGQVHDDLARIERYYDTVPRAAAQVEEVGPWTLFIGTGPFRFYGRPRDGVVDGFTVGDVDALVTRQRDLGVPRAIEWCAEIDPGLADVALAAGLAVDRHPLLVLDVPTPASPPASYRVQVLDPGDRQLAATEAAIGVGFASPGTAVGAAGVPERDAALGPSDTSRGSRSALMADGLLSVVAVLDHSGPVGGGSHAPRDGVTEITGVAVLPTHRRRGLAAAVTAALIDDAARRGVDLCFLAADGDDVARVYEGVGFVRRYTACTAVAGP
jgi:ribosomal protein S18 acetylase RimI-like enzyme